MLTAITVVGTKGHTRQISGSQLLPPDRLDRVRSDANRWIKQLRLVRYGDRTMRERFTFRGESLWWFTELYLHKMRRLEAALSTIAALEVAVGAHAPSGLVAECSSESAAIAARAFSAARGIPVDVTHTTAAPRRIDPGLRVGLSALLSRLWPAPRPQPGPVRVAAFVHTAFWRTPASAPAGRETYIGDVLDAMGTHLDDNSLRLVGVGPARTFASRRWWDPLVTEHRQRITPVEHYATRSHLAESLDLWRRRQQLAGEVTTGDDIRNAGRWGDFDLWPVLSAELTDAARIQWTWSARAMDEARAALTALTPDVAVTYAEAGGWGRALVLEARRLGIPTVGLQHGFIYRHWLNYQHEPDEVEPVGEGGGFPAPTRTLVFDRYAENTLLTAGHFAPASIAVTGSPRLDELVARLEQVRADRTAVRREAGVRDQEQLLVLAAKASEIAPHLPELFAAVAARPALRLLVKPHPAESREAYTSLVPPAAPIEVLESRDDLGRLLAACDGLVTMNSTVALDALVLGVPSLVVGLPNNLSPFVDEGVMAGAESGGIAAGIESLLYDRPAREALLARGKAFTGKYEMRADGGAARRAADAILAVGASRGLSS